MLSVARIAGCDRDDIHASTSPFVGRCHRQLANSTLAGCVTGDRDSALESQQRSREENPAAASLDHVLAEFASERERSVQVHFHHLVPIVTAMLGCRFAKDCPRCVDQNVDRRMIRLRLRDELVDGLAIQKNGSEKSHW